MNGVSSVSSGELALIALETKFGGGNGVRVRIRSDSKGYGAGRPRGNRHNEKQYGVFIHIIQQKSPFQGYHCLRLSCKGIIAYPPGKRKPSQFGGKTLGN